MVIKEASLARESPRAMGTRLDPCGLGILGIWTQEAERAGRV